MPNSRFLYVGSAGRANIDGGALKVFRLGRLAWLGPCYCSNWRPASLSSFVSTRSRAGYAALRAGRGL
jgi:hypothetical protein